MLRRALVTVSIVFASALVLAGCSGEDGSSSIPGGGGDRSVDGGAGGPGDAAVSSSADGSAADATPGDAAQPPLGPEESGEATYYDADGTGACGFPASTDFSVAAINDEQYSKANCGRCVEVTGPKGTTVVRIVDKCPGCDRGDLDLSKTAFSKIANLSDGRVEIAWHFVACP